MRARESHDVKRNEEIQGWGRRYGEALRAYLRKGASADVKPAARLGRRAATLGLETLDVAKVHEQALCAIPPSNGSALARQSMIARAQRFFTELLAPIERTHRASRKAEVRVMELTRTLQERKRETAASKRKLKRGIARRQSVEAALQESDAERARLLKESRNLQRQLRYRIRKLIMIQEDGRRKHSHHLRNEIAQTLLALDIRLLSLKEAGMAGIRKLSKEIAETQGLVRQSGKTLMRLAHDSKKEK